MNKKWIAAAIVALPAAIGGIAYATAQSRAAGEVQQTSEEGYACPLTGEVLPCPNCCALQQE